MKSGNAVRCILVLGMYGSGTSALTRMFSLAGAALPRTLLEANEADGTGCWEPERLVRYHDRLLSDLGSSWHDWKPLDFPSLPLSDRKTIHSDIKSILADEFGGRRLWVLKEPRICRFVPIYREVLSDMGVALSPVLIFRNPLEVMASLQRRGDWPVERSAADACLLWLRHVLDCEAATRGVKRSIASHASIVSDPVAALARIERKAKLDFPNKVDELGEDIREFLDPASGGHEKGGGEAALEPMLRGWVDDAFSAMRALERNPGSKKARKTLDRVNEAFGASLPVINAFGAASREALAHKHKLEEEVQARDAEAKRGESLRREDSARLESRILDLQTAVSEKSAVLKALEEEREQIRLDFEGLDRIAGEQSGQLDAIRRLFDVGEGDNRTIDEVIGAHLHSLQAEYDSRLNSQTEDHEGILNSQAADYEGRLAARTEEFTREREQIRLDFEGLDRIAGEQSGQLDAIRRLFDVGEGDNRTIDEVIGAHLHSLQAEYDSRLNSQTEDHEGILNSQAADYEERLAARTEEFTREREQIRLDFEGLDRLTEEQKSRIESLDRITGEQSGQLDAIRRLFDVGEGDNRTIDEVIGAHLHSLQAEYDSCLNAQAEDHAKRLDGQAADYEGRLAARTEEFTREREQARLDFEGLDRIAGEQSGQLDAIRRLFDVGEGDNRTIEEVIGAHLHSLQAEYDSRLNARAEDHAKRLDGQAADYEGRLAARTEEFAREREQARLDFEGLDRIAGEQSGQLDAIRRLFDVGEGDNRTIEEVIGAHLHSLQAEYDSRLNARAEDHAKRLDGQAADYEGRLAARTEEFAREREQARLDFEGLDRIAGEQSGQLDAIRRLFDIGEGDNRTIDEVIGAHLHSLQAEYDSRLNAQAEDHAKHLDGQAADYEERLAARTEEFAREKDRLTGQVASLGEDYAKRLDGQAADYEERLAARTEEFAREKDRLTGQVASLGEDYAKRLDGQAADYEERLAARTEEFAREKDRLADQMASLGEDYAERLDGQAADYEERLAARAEEFAREKDRLTGQVASLGEDYAERLDGQTADYEERLAASAEEFAREKDRLTDQMASLGEDYAERLDGQAADYEERLAARTEEFAREKDRLTDQMASLGDERDAISGEAQYLNAANNDLRAAYDAASLDLRREKTTVLRPIYRNVYGAGGRLMRGVLPESVVHWVKDKVPDPDGARFNGASLDLPYAPTGPARLEDVSPGVGKPDVFVLSIIDWDFRIQRPQHIARALSSDRRVFYVEMMMEREEPAVRKIADNLWAVRLSMDGAGHIQPYSGEPDADRQAAWVRSFFEFCRVVDASPFKQIVVQHPFWWNLVRHLPPEFEIVFDCMDDITGFSNTSQAVIDLENDLLKGCDKLVVSSQYLFDKYRDKAPALIRNGGDINHFSADAAAGPAPPFLAGSGFEKREGTIDAGYVGAVAEWFDHELIRRTATQNPDIRFHICGDVTVPEPAALDDLDNVHLYGEIAYDDVPAFIRQMDVMTIPFKLLPIIHACDPVKFYEHSAMGKPTVSTRLPELMRAEELIYFAETAEQYGARIRDACAAGALPEYRDKLRLYAAENSWAHRGEEFDAALGRFAKVSVVILAFGDALWTGTTLQSLFDGGDHYPDLEVIVVDNGSDDATLAELRKTCASHPGVRLIENGENLGFARGNNAGLSAAAGEYVLLLNNDTYLAPGAIHAMVRHLRDNPGIGVVGPLTNNIGNEARLDVHYADMAEMIDVARSVTTGYRGMYSPVRVSAYFAAMFRTADLETFGLLPEEYGRGMFEDDDHCETIRKHGFICALAEDAFVHHHLSGTFSMIGGDEKRRLFERNRAVFEAKWGAWIPHEYRSDRPVGSLSNDNLKPTTDE